MAQMEAQADNKVGKLRIMFFGQQRKGLLKAYFGEWHWIVSDEGKRLRAEEKESLEKLRVEEKERLLQEQLEATMAEMQTFFFKFTIYADFFVKIYGAI